MQIFTQNNNRAYLAFCQNRQEQEFNRKRTLCTLPLFTLSEELLKSILKRNWVEAPLAAEILAQRRREAEQSTKILQKNKITDVIYSTEMAFAENAAVGLHCRICFWKQHFLHPGGIRKPPKRHFAVPKQKLQGCFKPKQGVSKYFYYRGSGAVCANYQKQRPGHSFYNLPPQADARH